MELAIGSKYLIADVTTALDKTGQEHLLIVVKGSWHFANGRAKPIQAMPHQFGDMHSGKAGISAPLYESDFVLHKPRCDVLFDARAYAPEGKPVRELLAGFQIGQQQKIVRIHGPRHWQGNQASVGAAEEFLEIPLHYGYAFGGTRTLQDGTSESYTMNPVGCGFSTDPAALENQPMPNLEAPNQAITRPDVAYPPMALSVQARNWLPRRSLSGTYDAAWKRDIFPFLPEDFDVRFHQAAPIDQQIDYPKGGEDVMLWNLMRNQPEMRFKLPRLDKVPIRILMRNFVVEEPVAVVDTLFFEPDQARLTAVWRASMPLIASSNPATRRQLPDVSTIVIAGVCKNWWEAKMVGAEGCMNCAKQRSTLETAPSEEECQQEGAQHDAIQ